MRIRFAFLEWLQMWYNHVLINKGQELNEKNIIDQ